MQPKLRMTSFRNLQPRSSGMSVVGSNAESCFFAVVFLGHLGPQFAQLPDMRPPKRTGDRVVCQVSWGRQEPLGLCGSRDRHDGRPSRFVCPFRT